MRFSKKVNYTLNNEFNGICIVNGGGDKKSNDIDEISPCILFLIFKLAETNANFMYIYVAATNG